MPPGILSEPAWRPRRRLRRGCLPPEVAAWLLDSGSLTHRLRRRCPGDFRVEVVRQGRAVPAYNERERLGLRRAVRVLVREVFLYCGDTPWVFARTVIPPRTLRGRARYLARLGSRPLGAALFADPTMERGELEVCCVRRGEVLHAAASARLRRAPDCIWGRRSVFYIGGRPLLVAELFLPPLLASG